jgi:hypothetical protein
LHRTLLLASRACKFERVRTQSPSATHTVRRRRHRTERAGRRSVEARKLTDNHCTHMQTRDIKEDTPHAVELVTVTVCEDEKGPRDVISDGVRPESERAGVHTRVLRSRLSTRSSQPKRRASRFCDTSQSDQSRHQSQCISDRKWHEAWLELTIDKDWIPLTPSHSMAAWFRERGIARHSAGGRDACRRGGQTPRQPHQCECECAAEPRHHLHTISACAIGIRDGRSWVREYFTSSDSDTF